jgi:predicted CXXCH cytochrome family protein
MASISVSSTHDMPTATNPDNFGPAYGGKYNATTIDPATGVVYPAGTYDKLKGGISVAMDCSSCHDPHGSSNYRLLKDTVNDTETGGYVTSDLKTAIDPNPKPFVISNEIGYPSGNSVLGNDFGFRLHKQYPNYKPDYTTARYARAPKFSVGADDTVTVDMAGIDAKKGLSAWCAGCHTEYNTVSSMGQSAYNANDGLLDTVRHRHPVNIPLTNADGILDRDILIATSSDTNSAWGDNIDIPLEHNPYGENQGSSQRQAKTDFIGCLTCHRAHGTNTTMTGYALGGLPTADSSALLRANNRGVCERCHNK